MRRRELAPLYVVAPAWWAAATFLFCALLTFGFWESYANPWLVLGAACVAGPLMGVPLSSHGEGWARFLPLGWCLLHGLVLSQVVPPLTDIAQVWTVLASALALGGLAMMGNTVTVLVAMSLSTVAGLLVGGRAQLDGMRVLEMITFVTPTLVGICYGLVMHRAVDAADATAAEEARVRQQLLELESRAEARADYQAQLARTSGEMLDRMARGQRLSATERVECGLVEAQLRDAIRGRSLATDEVLMAARGARSRGARVLLVDDRRRWDCSAELRGQVLTTAVDALDLAADGDACTVRLLPPGRKNLATVLLSREHSDSVRHDFPSPGPLSGSVGDGAHLT